MGKNSRPKSLFNKFFGINVTLLKIERGFNCVNSSRNPVGLVILASTFIWMLGKWNQVIFDDNISKEAAVEGISRIFSSYLTLTKAFSVIFFSKNVDDILQCLSKMWDDRYEMVKNRNVMLSTAKRAYNITIFYVATSFLASVMFHVFPYKSIVDQYLEIKDENKTYNFTTILLLKYPMDVNYLGNYIPVMIIEHIVLLSFTIYFISSDTLYYQLLTHLCLHFKLLRNDLENIVSKATLTYDPNKSNREGLEKLSKIVERQNELYSLSEQVERLFRSVFFMSMLVTSFIICLALHETQSKIMIGKFWEGIGDLSHSLILLSQAAIYCGCSNMLSYETELLAIAAYNCPWPFLGKQFGSQLKLLIVRAQKTFRFTAYGLFRIDLPQLSTIVSAAMTYFTLLNTLVKKK